MKIWLLVKEYLPILLKAAGVTLGISGLSLVFSLIIGLIMGMFRISKNFILTWIATLYINAIRGTPLLIQILIVYFGIPSLLNISFSAFTAGVVIMSIYTGAYMAEIYRSGIESVDIGQTEAGRSLGLSNSLTMRLIVLPQAIRKMIPTFVNQITIMIKDTSLLSVIGVVELTMQGQMIYSVNFKTFEILIIVAIIYFIIVYALTRFSIWIEGRIKV